jgi:hypothetical protein
MNGHGESPEQRTTRTGAAAASGKAAEADDLTLRRIGEALQGLRFGSVLTIVQDGVVVQIERTEKTRFHR